MTHSPLIEQLFIGVAIMTSMGTLVQDTRVNKALEVAVPLSSVGVNLSSHLDGLNEAASSHQRVEQTSVTQDLAGIPRVQARDDHRRYYSPRYTSRSDTSSGGSQINWPQA